MARLTGAPEAIADFAEGVVRADWQGTPYRMAKHHREWLHLWAENDRLLLEAARGHGKTETLVVLPNLWLATATHDELSYIVSSTQDQANKILGRIKTIIERELPWLVNDDRWATQEILTTTRYNIVAKGAGNKMIGPHPQHIFVDDIVEDPQTVADSAIERWFFASLFPMLSKDGRLSVTGTPKHMRDVYNAIEQRGVFKVAKYPAYAEDGSVLWPEYWTREMIEERRAALGSVLFSREYMLKPVDEASSLFPMHAQTECFDDKQALVKRYPGPLEVFVGVDPAASAAIGADYTVAMIESFDPETERRQILDIVREKGMTLEQHVQMIAELEERYRPARVVIEKNAFQRWLEQEASKALRNVPITGHVTGKEKSDLREGVPSLSLLIERRQLVIPRGLTADEEQRGVKAWESEAVRATDPLVRELNSMTWDAGKVVSVGEHDDTVMALWLCETGIREGAEARGIAFASIDEQPRKSRASAAARRFGTRD